MERQLGFPGRYGRLFGYISNMDIEVTWCHQLMGMVRPVLGLRALLSVCGYVRSFSRYWAKRVSPSVGVAIFRGDSYECKCSMVPRNDGNYQPYSWATYTFIRLWLCAVVREKIAKKEAISPTRGNIKELHLEKRTQPRHISLNFILTYF